MNLLKNIFLLVLIASSIHGSDVDENQEQESLKCPHSHERGRSSASMQMLVGENPFPNPRGSLESIRYSFESFEPEPGARGRQFEAAIQLAIENGELIENSQGEIEPVILEEGKLSKKEQEEIRANMKKMRVVMVTMDEFRRGATGNVEQEKKKSRLQRLARFCCCCCQ